MNMPDGDGWTAHDGGPCPVGECDWVRVRLRDGYEFTEPRIANRFDWAHHTPDPEIEIVAYRLAQPDPAAPEAEWLANCKRNHDAFVAAMKPEPAACEHDIEPPSWCRICTPPARLARDMTVRERMAMEIMPAVYAEFMRYNLGFPEDWREGLGRDAVRMADALIATLKESNDD